MPDARFVSLEPELQNALKEFKAYLEKQGFEQTPLNFLVRGATRFGLFLVRQPVQKGDSVPRKWRP